MDWQGALARGGCDEAAADEGAAHLAAWLLRHPEDEAALVHQAAHAPAELARCFGTAVRFGTGGVRGRVGPGPGGLNLETARILATAHAAWLGSGAVVLGWDMRAFEDREGRCGEVPPSVQGLRSIDLARAASEAYRAAGIDVWWPEGETVSTPMASYLVTALGVDGAMVVTASHNPADDNGLKLYGRDGVQLAPPEDEEVLRHRGVRPPQGEGALHRVAADVCHRFIETVGALGGGAAKVVYSPLHGTGRDVVAPALEAAGFEVVLVGEQCVLDPAFGTLPGGSANPENPEVYGMATALADDVGADVVFTTDPDADRIGMSVRAPDGWRMLNGHQLAVLALSHRLSTHEGPGVVLTTEVTTRWLGRMARDAGLDVVEHLPVGFKFLGRWRRDEVAELPLVLAAEESHGLLVHDAAGDKDACGAAVILASAVSQAQARGVSVLETLEAVRARFGDIQHVQRSARLTGLGARERLLQRLAVLAATPPEYLGDAVVVDAVDRGNEPDRGWVSASEAASWKALVWDLGDAGRVIVRPSGTEPKVKVYAECWQGLHAAAYADAALALITG